MVRYFSHTIDISTRSAQQSWQGKCNTFVENDFLAFCWFEKSDLRHCKQSIRSIWTGQPQQRQNTHNVLVNNQILIMHKFKKKKLQCSSSCPEIDPRSHIWGQMTWNQKALGIVFLARPFSCRLLQSASLLWRKRVPLASNIKAPNVFTEVQFNVGSPGNAVWNCLPQYISAVVSFETSTKTPLPADSSGTGSFSLSSCFTHCCGDGAIFTFSLWRAVFFFCHVLLLVSCTQMEHCWISELATANSIRQFDTD